MGEWDGLLEAIVSYQKPTEIRGDEGLTGAAKLQQEKSGKRPREEAYRELP